jgi:hypothetical protein
MWFAISPLAKIKMSRLIASLSRKNSFGKIVFLICGLLGVWISYGQSQPDAYKITEGTSRCQSEFRQFEIHKNGQIVLADLKGPGKINYFYLTDDTGGNWYPGLVLKVYWDGETNASIEVPLEDFFGIIGGRSVDFESAFFQIHHFCYMCYLPMPFSREAKVVLANDGDRDYSQKLAYGLDFVSDVSYSSEKSRLHCEWRRSNPVANGLHTILEANGRGQYVGSFLQVASRNRNIWFGEGDTIFHLDGQVMHHSPGTEDEYGACWEGPGWGIFSNSTCGHLLNREGVNRMYRWYVANPVRFQNSLKVEIQNQHDNGTATTAGEADDYISVAFWYQEGAHSVSALPSFKVRTAPSFLNP